MFFTLKFFLILSHTKVGPRKWTYQDIPKHTAKYNWSISLKFVGPFKWWGISPLLKFFLAAKMRELPRDLPSQRPHSMQLQVGPAWKQQLVNLQLYSIHVPTSAKNLTDETWSSITSFEIWYKHVVMLCCLPNSMYPEHGEVWWISINQKQCMTMTPMRLTNPILAAPTILKAPTFSIIRYGSFTSCNVQILQICVEKYMGKRWKNT